MRRRIGSSGGGSYLGRDALFLLRTSDDLESQLDREHRDEQRALAIEEERLRLGRLVLRDRLAAISLLEHDEAVVQLELIGGQRVALRSRTFGRDWVSGDCVAFGGRDTQVVLPLAAVAAVLPTRTQLDPSLEKLPERTSQVAERMTISFVLRDLCRRRTAVTVSTLDGTVHGTFDRVARDHIDLALHDHGAARRERDVHGYRIVPLERVLLVAFE